MELLWLNQVNSFRQDWLGTFSRYTYQVKIGLFLREPICLDQALNDNDNRQRPVHGVYVDSISEDGRVCGIKPSSLTDLGQ